MHYPLKRILVWSAGTLLVAVGAAVAETLPGEVLSVVKVNAEDAALAAALEDGDYFGTAADAIGDLDGDGLVEMAVGAPGDDDGGLDVGAIWILFLDRTGEVRSQRKISPGSGGLAIDVDEQYGFGSSVAGVGDLDGDGVPDLAIGSLNDDDGSPPGKSPLGGNRGAVWILFLRPDGSVRAYTKISDTGGGFAGTLDEGDNFGSSVAGLGDLDGDGVPDLAVGAWGDDGGGTGAYQGAVWILFMHPDGTVRSHQKIDERHGGFTGVLGPGDNFGSSVAGLGDLDRDGVPDLAVGADQMFTLEAGAVWILFLARDGTVKDWHLVHALEYGLGGLDPSFAAFGWSLGSPGDIDRDGVVDLAVGAIGHTDIAESGPDGDFQSGAVWILFLRPDGSFKRAQGISNLQGNLGETLPSSHHFGFSIAPLGDLDGDGRIDIGVGSYQGPESAGQVRLLLLNGPLWDDLGGGLPAVGGSAPHLSGRGSLVAHDDVALSLRAAPPATAGVLVASTVHAGMPLHGGVLVPSPDLLLLTGPTDAAGAATLSGRWPPGASSGTAWLFQVWMPHPSAPDGWVASNALKGVTP